MKASKYIWLDGSLVAWEDATVHVMSHGLHYGSSVFEGLRCYETPLGPAIFRLGDHIRRLLDSAKIYRIECRWSAGELCEACREVISANELGNAYLRPILYLGAGTLALDPQGECETGAAIGAFEWGAYLGQEGIREGIDACISSWNRSTSASIPVLAKAGGHYLNAQLICTEAHRHGYLEGISVNSHGMVAEGSGENLFLVRDGKIFTPPLAASILGGITRDSVLQIAAHLGYEVREEALPRELLYIADEIFLTGTAAEITPVRSVDRIDVGSGKPGPMTRAIQDVFFGLFDGSQRDIWGWLEPVARKGDEPNREPRRSGVAGST
jgi:branched-chain amino acid aminotransferase